MQQMDRDRDKQPSEPDKGAAERAARANSLLDRQLQDILKNAERTHRRQLYWRRFRGTAGMVMQRTRGSGRSTGAGRLMIWGLGLVLIGALLGRVVPQLAAMFVVAGVIVFVSPIFLSLFGGRRGSSGDERVWRGRVIEYPRRDPIAMGRRWVQGLLQRRGGPPPRKR